jgi:hypothetical protein
MYSVESDRSNRLLVISAAGQVTKKEVKSAALQIREIMNEITPGFRVLTDFRWLDRMEPAALPHLAEIMDAVAAKNVVAVIRVVPDPHKDIGLNILSQFHLRHANQASYLRVVSGSVVSVDGQRNLANAGSSRRPAVVAAIPGRGSGFPGGPKAKMTLLRLNKNLARRRLQTENIGYHASDAQCDPEIGKENPKTEKLFAQPSMSASLQLDRD